MAQQKLKLNIDGLYLHPNDLSEVPSGALEIADNIVIDRESVAQSRRGFKQYGPEVFFFNPRKIFNFQDKLILHSATDFWVDDGAGNWTLIVSGYDTPQTGLKMQAQEMNNNIYFTTDTGVVKLDAPVASADSPAGIPQALDLNVASLPANPAGILPNTLFVGYRVTFSKTDVNKNLIESAPSNRLLVENTTGVTADVELEVTIPDGIAAGDTLNVYRTRTSNLDPGDDPQLVKEIELQAGDITAGVITFTDSTPDANKGAVLYSSSTQEGILQANTQPPFALDITEFRNYMWYANTRRAELAEITLDFPLSVGVTVTIGAQVYTAAASENIALSEFDGTAASLVKVINRQASNNDYNAFLISGGTIAVQNRDVNAAAFTVAISTGETFASDNARAKNGVSFSKFQQPEAVPLLNTLPVGDEDKEIIRILSIEDALFVLKEDGIFRITGTDPSNFFVEQHDITVRMVGPETAVQFGNQVLCMSNQGVVAITPTGVTLVSRPIERVLLRLSLQDAFEQTAFGVAYDADRKYLLAVPSSDGETKASQVFVFDSLTQSWTRWPLDLYAGIVKNREDELYLIKYIDDSLGTIKQERKTRTLADYADEEYSTNLISVTPVVFPQGTTYTLEVASVANVEVGFTVKQGARSALITAVDTTNKTVTVVDNITWQTGQPVTFYEPIQVILQWSKSDADNPGILKHFSEISMFFDDARFNQIDLLTASNLAKGFVATSLVRTGPGLWGAGPWGDFPWGGGLGGDAVIRTFIPRQHARAHWVKFRIELNQALTDFTFTGMSLLFNVMNTKFKG